MRNKSTKISAMNSIVKEKGRLLVKCRTRITPFSHVKLDDFAQQQKSEIAFKFTRNVQQFFLVFSRGRT